MHALFHLYHSFTASYFPSALIFPQHKHKHPDPISLADRAGLYIGRRRKGNSTVTSVADVVHQMILMNMRPMRRHYNNDKTNAIHNVSDGNVRNYIYQWLVTRDTYFIAFDFCCPTNILCITWELMGDRTINLTLKVLVATIDAQYEGMGDAGSYLIYLSQVLYVFV